MGILRADRITGLGGANAIKGSTQFDGDLNYQGNFLAIGDSDDFNLGSGDFTIEAWIYASALSSNNFEGIIGQWPASGANANNSWVLEVVGGDLEFYYCHSGATLVGPIQGGSIKENEWTHVMATRSGNTMYMFINGTAHDNSGQSVTHTFNDSTYDVTIGGYIATAAMWNGNISNVRVIKGTALHTSNFTVPTNQLVTTSDTVLLTCQSSSNILIEETGKLILPRRNNINGSFPSASKFTPNSPVGFSTTSDVGSQYGSTFDGFGNFASSTYMVPPGGNTRERNRGRALLGGGHNGSGATNHIHHLSIQSQGNTEDFGDLTYTRWIPAPSSSSTRGVWSGGGGYNPGSPTGSYVNFIDFVTIANSSNATDFGDQTAEKGYHAGFSNETRGIIAGGYNDSVGKIDVIEFITIATAGNAQDFGDLTAARMQLAAAGSPTRGLFFGGAGNPNVLVDVIDYITIATTGNATDFGDMTAVTKYGNATSSNTRAIYAGGLSPNDTTYVNVIQFVTIASTGNATDFGDLTTARSTTPGATSNNIRGIFAGGFAPGNLNSIDFVTIATTGNASDFGDILYNDMRGIGALSDSHGGLE